MCARVRKCVEGVPNSHSLVHDTVTFTIHNGTLPSTLLELVPHYMEDGNRRGVRLICSNHPFIVAQDLIWSVSGHSR
jgi:hypothetical protein